MPNRKSVLSRIAARAADSPKPPTPKAAPTSEDDEWIAENLDTGGERILFDRDEVLQAMGVVRDQARRKTAAEIIESLMPVGPLTNRTPSRHLALVEEYIAEQFGVTDSDIEEVFQIEHDRRNVRQQLLDKLRANEQRVTALERRLALARKWIPDDKLEAYDKAALREGQL